MIVEKNEQEISNKTRQRVYKLANRSKPSQVEVNVLLIGSYTFELRQKVRRN